MKIKKTLDMRIPDTLQKGIAVVIGLGFIAAMVYEIAWNFEKSIFNRFWFWLIVLPLCLINLKGLAARQDMGGKTKVLLMLILLFTAVVMLYTIVRYFPT